MGGGGRHDHRARKYRPGSRGLSRGEVCGSVSGFYGRRCILVGLLERGCWRLAVGQHCLLLLVRLALSDGGAKLPACMRLVARPRCQCMRSACHCLGPGQHTTHTSHRIMHTARANDYTLHTICTPTQVAGQRTLSTLCVRVLSVSVYSVQIQIQKKNL